MKSKIQRFSVRGNRIWLSKKIQKRIGKRFIRIELKSPRGLRRAEFLTIITKDGRFVIPKNVREKLGLKYNDSVDLQTETVRNGKRGREFFRKRGFDMMAFVPEKTMSGFTILADCDKSWVRLWYSTKGRPREIRIKRFLPIEFSRLLGYYQAEGGKLKLRKRRGREFSFTNKSPEAIEEFIRLSKHLFDSKFWNATVRYNTELNEADVGKVVSFLKGNGISADKIKCRPADKISTYVIRLWITSSLLAETVFGMTKSLMRYLLDNGWGERETYICKCFLQGLIAGDGGFISYRDKKGSLHSRLYLYDAKEEHIKIYAGLLSKFWMPGKIRKDKKRNCFIFTSHLNWNNLLTLLEYGLLDYSVHKNRFRRSIKEHKRYRTLKYLLFIDKNISVHSMKKVTKKLNSYNSVWIRDMIKEGILNKIRKNYRGINICELSGKGNEIKNILKLL